MDRWAFVWGCWWIDATCISFQFCPRVNETEYFPFSHQSDKQRWELKKSQNGDTLGPVELIVWPEQGNQGDWLEHDDHGEVSIIIFGMSES